MMSLADRRLSVRTINTGGMAHGISEGRRPRSCGGRCLPRARESSSDLQISHTTTIRIARQIRKTTPKSERIAAASFDAGSSTGTAEANNRSRLGWLLQNIDVVRAELKPRRQSWRILYGIRGLTARR